jgi:glutamyl/glutaminyl-tRNA synthetase
MAIKGLWPLSAIEAQRDLPHRDQRVDPSGQSLSGFCTTEDLDKIRKFQEANKVLPGYYGVYARDRNLSVDEEIAKIKAGTPWVIRYRSNGDHDKKTSFVDAIRGKIELQDNDVDVVILKSDGLPTYHFAHVCDDHFMHTTLVTRGEEWIPSTPIHLDMFKALGWEAPKYAHLPVIMKLDHGNKRKLSKRKDPEGRCQLLLGRWLSARSLLVYLMSIANSNFEEWSIAAKISISRISLSPSTRCRSMARSSISINSIISRKNTSRRSRPKYWPRKCRLGREVQRELPDQDSFG